MEHTKEHALSDYMNMIHHAWTYDRMTEDEKARVEKAFQFANEQGVIKGSFNSRWKIMQAIYNSFLEGIGYTGAYWREPNPDEVPFVCGE